MIARLISDWSTDHVPTGSWAVLQLEPPIETGGGRRPADFVRIMQASGTTVIPCDRLGRPWCHKILFESEKHVSQKACAEALGYEWSD